MSTHSISERHIEVITSIITAKKNDEGVNILFYGEPGSGKTEFARTLATHLEMNLYEITCDNKKGFTTDREPFNRYTAFYTCENTTPKDNCIILVDEADEMLNGSNNGNFISLFGKASSRNTEKNKINKLLDTTHATVIWITNHYNGIESSTRRRFDYSLRFSDFTREQRSNIWNNVVDSYKLGEEITQETIHELVNMYPLNAGGVDVVLRNYARLPVASRSHSMLITLVEQHSQLMNEKRIQQAYHPVKNYSLEGINVKGDQSLEETVEILQQFDIERNVPDKSRHVPRNMNMLLYGPPGTGKSEFVKYLAHVCDKELIILRGSDLLNCYVGETEKNIAAQFRRAENERAILFIDEADGMFFSRDNAVRHFEASQVNEMLSQMENFNGILVCATNHHKNMDSATFRRFTLKYQFDYLTREGVQLFYDMYLTPLIGTGDATELQNRTLEEDAQLASLVHLTPGDFKTVAQKYIFVKNEKRTHKKMIEALVTESSYKSGVTTHTIGF